MRFCGRSGRRGRGRARRCGYWCWTRFGSSVPGPLSPRRELVERQTRLLAAIPCVGVEVEDGPARLGEGAGGQWWGAGSCGGRGGGLGVRQEDGAATRTGTGQGPARGKDPDAARTSTQQGPGLGQGSGNNEPEGNAQRIRCGGAVVCSMHVVACARLKTRRGDKTTIGAAKTGSRCLVDRVRLACSSLSPI